MKPYNVTSNSADTGSQHHKPQYEYILDDGKEQTVPCTHCDF